MTGLKLAEVHRRHLGTEMRDADREVTLHRGGLPEADSMSLAAHLLGTLTTPSQAAVKAEMRLHVQEALNSMDPTDREVLALKHFEQLSTSEIAEVLGMSKAGAGSRYLRAIKRLGDTVEKIPGFEGLPVNPSPPLNPHHSPSTPPSFPIFPPKNPPQPASTPRPRARRS